MTSTMTLHEARKIISAIATYNKYSRRAGEAELAEEALELLKLIPATPYTWADTWITKTARNGVIPDMISLAGAWREEAAMRIPAIGADPEPPAEIADDPVRWKQWVITYRRGLLAGKDRDEAQQIAASAVGARLQITSATAAGTGRDVTALIAERITAQTTAARKAQHARDEARFAQRRTPGGQ